MMDQIKHEDKKDFDLYGNERSLHWMIRNRPGWAQSMLAFYGDNYESQQTEIKKLKQDCKNLIDINNNQAEIVEAGNA
jgi:hypothetical protein